MRANVGIAMGGGTDIPIESADNLVQLVCVTKEACRANYLMDIHATEVELRDLMIAGLDGNAAAHKTRLFTPWMYAIARYKFVDYLRRTSAEASDVPVEEAEEVLAHNDHAAVESSLDLESLMAGISDQARRYTAG